MPQAKNNLRKKKSQPARRAAAPAAKSRGVAFGPVSCIDTAPIAIGNSMRGARAQVIKSSLDEVRLVGRDFAQTAYNSGTTTGWVPVAGFPLTPACFISSVLRNYTQMYNKFKFNLVRIHYITSSPTTANGDVLFQVVANRSDALPNWSGQNFLPYVLSKPETVIGPQWTNHTIEFVPKGPFRTLNLGQNLDVDYQAQGEVLMYSKTSTTDSPGYLIIDYDITFSEMSVNPKVGVLPNPALLYTQAQLVWPTTALTDGTTTLNLSAGTRGAGGASITALTSQSTFRRGDIYKFVCDVTNTNMTAYTVSAGAVPTAATLFNQSLLASAQDMTISDGFTIYILVVSSTTINLYPNLSAAFTQSGALRAGSTSTPNAYGEAAGVPNAGVWLYGIASFVGNLNPENLQVL